MKKQETVENNFHKSVLSWSTRKEERLGNIEKQKQEIKEKISKLNQHILLLNSEAEKIRQEEPPKAPTVQQRLLQVENSKKMDLF